jgi:hypothetical protein
MPFWQSQTLDVVAVKIGQDVPLFATLNLTHQERRTVRAKVDAQTMKIRHSEKLLNEGQNL